MPSTASGIAAMGDGNRPKSSVDLVAATRRPTRLTACANLDSVARTVHLTPALLVKDNAHCVVQLCGLHEM